MKVLFYLGYASLTEGYYGSELAFLNLANALTKYYDIYVMALVYTILPKDSKIKLVDPKDYLRSDEMYDVIIISRYINFYIYMPIKAPKVYLWLHDVLFQPAYEGQMLFEGGRYLLENVQCDKVIVQTQWHKEIVDQYNPKLKEKTIVIGNGIHTKNFAKQVPKIPGSFIYTSSPKRGLTYLLDHFSEVKKIVPNAHLHIYRGPEEFTPEQNNKIKAMKDCVTYNGKLDNTLLTEKFLESEYWLYPTDFHETFCISGLEALAAGCICITSQIGALTELIGDRGIVINSPPNGDNYWKEVISSLKNIQNKKEVLALESRKYAKDCDWENRAKKWCELIGPSTKQQKKAITLKCNWTSDPEKSWKDRGMIPDDYKYDITPDSDTVIVFNGLFGTKYDERKHIRLTMEPKCNTGHLPQDWLSVTCPLSRNSIEWHIPKDALQGPYPKVNRVSAIISSENRLPGHHLRHRLIALLEKENFDYDLYGTCMAQVKAFKYPIDLKDEGLLCYNYHIAFENCSEQGFFTEKLVDSILCECLTFYWGCPDIDRYIDPRAIVIVKDEVDCFEKMRKALQEDWYTSRLKYIQNEKKRILYGWSIFPTIDRLLSNTECPGDIPTFVINLERRFDRWQYITKELLGMPYIRVDAVDGRKLGNLPDKEYKMVVINQQSKKRNPYPFHNYRLGVLGCIFSHIKLWEQIATFNKFALVLEDDIVLQTNFPERWKNVSEYLVENKDWDLCFLGYLDDVDTYDDPIVSSRDSIRVLSFNPGPARRNGGGTHAYCISPRGARTLLGLISKYPINQPIDWWMIERFPDVKALKCSPHLIEPLMNGDTDIQNN